MHALAPLCWLSSCRLDGLAVIVLLGLLGFRERGRHGRRETTKSAIRIRETMESLTQQKFPTQAGVFLVCTIWKKKKDLYRGPLGLNLLSRVGLMQEWAPSAEKKHVDLQSCQFSVIWVKLYREPECATERVFPHLRVKERPCNTITVELIDSGRPKCFQISSVNSVTLNIH